jgi:molecular chaperone DnaK (HSP70)
MLKKHFSIAEFVDPTAEAVPTILAYDRDAAKFVIGGQARRITLGLQPAVQDFKSLIGEADAIFEGRYAPVKGTRPSKLWEVRADAPDRDRWISTKEAVRVFLKEFFSQLGDIPEQLIIGVPATSNDVWLRQFRVHLSQVLTELGHPDPQFFPEPFAVFQYYRHVERVLPASGKPLVVLVVDFGGGTLDSCIIETTLEGNLARGGSTSVPLGIHSVTGAGKAIDRRLVELAVSKCKDARLRQDSPQARMAARPWVVLAAEEIKIALSQQMQECRLGDDCGHIVEKRDFPAAWYHPDVPVRFEITGNDLKQVIEELWFAKQNGFGLSILSTLQEAKFRGGVARLERIDKVILAGGSSGLPYLRELLYRTLSGHVKIEPEDIIIGEHCDKAVAYGAAVEAAEERNRSLRTHHSIGPCVFNELFLFAAPRRDELPIRPKVTLISDHKKVSLEPGTLLTGPMQLRAFQSEYEIHLPYRPHGVLFYWFTDKDNPEDARTERLNVQQDIVRLPPKFESTLRLRIAFDDKRGMISPEFSVGTQAVQGAAFNFGGLRIAEDVRSYAGIDFGTSNCYAVNLWAVPKPKHSPYPEFRLSEAAGARLRELEDRISTYSVYS